jgi:hypothetical protein
LHLYVSSEGYWPLLVTVKMAKATFSGSAHLTPVSQLLPWKPGGHVHL